MIHPLYVIISSHISRVNYSGQSTLCYQTMLQRSHKDGLIPEHSSQGCPRLIITRSSPHPPTRSLVTGHRWALCVNRSSRLDFRSGDRPPHLSTPLALPLHPLSLLLLFPLKHTANHLHSPINKQTTHTHTQHPQITITKETT